MNNRFFGKAKTVLPFLLLAVVLLSAGCNSTQHVGSNQYLLRKNNIILKSPARITNRGEVKDYLSKLIIQKPNTRTFGVPFKLWLYNKRYDKLKNRSVDSLPKSVQRPVIEDSVYRKRTIKNMKNYLFAQGYFYPEIKDTAIIRGKKAKVTYRINTGINYRINNVHYLIEDSAIAQLVKANEPETRLINGTEFKYSLLEEEISRLTAIMRNNGYYKFTQENINFLNGIDTLDKRQFKNAESPFENVLNFVLSEKTKQNKTLDLEMHISLADDSAAFTKFRVGKVDVYPDYNTPADIKDNTMTVKKLEGINFRYHSNYVHPYVLYEHIYLMPGSYYSQTDFDKSIAKLTELGLFQYIRIVPYENRAGDGKNILDFDIFLKKTKKHDFGTNYEISSGQTYFLGNSISLSYKDRNLLKGANLLTIGINGGLELTYNGTAGTEFTDHFSLLTRYYGANASIDFPKFLAPVASSLFDNSNLPHTIISGGENVSERVNYFTLVNTSANFSYSWHQNQTITWNLTPAFINIIRLPVETQAFDSLISSNAYLRNSYKENFIEGENISVTYDNSGIKHGANFSVLKLSFEEAGGILGIANKLGSALNDLYKIKYAQYTKLDLEAKHYFTFPHSVVAMRFLGGIGIPYGQTNALPYIKQYFSGGPYSLRGWRIRTLGPGSYIDTKTSSQIDRTADIKLEFNTEYRFPIVPLFAGAVKMNGALFVDAGNIWLAHADTQYAGGNFTFASMGQGIAADMGFGTRFDIASFLTFRLDVAVPMKKPYVHNNSGWVFNEISLKDATWRANNIVFNISIGYPF